MTQPVRRTPFHTPPVHTMGLGHLPLAVLATILIASLFAAAFHLGYVPPIAAVSLLVLIVGFAAIDVRGARAEAMRADATQAGAATAGSRFTVARLALVCVLAGAAASRVGTPPDLMLWALAAMGAATAVLDAMDGWITRITGSDSAYAGRLSGLVSCVLTLALALLAWQLGRAGEWVVLAGLPAFLVRPPRAAETGHVAAIRRTWAGLAANAMLAASLVPALPAWAPAPLGAAALAATVGLAGHTVIVRRRLGRSHNGRISES